MDAINTPLLPAPAGKGLNDSKLLNTSITISGDNKTKEEHAALRQHFQDIKASVLDSFKFKNIKLPFECVTIRTSIKHSLIIGAHKESDQIALLDLKNSTQEKKLINTGQGQTTCIRFSHSEDLIFIGTDLGKIVSYSFPSMTSPQVYEAGTGNVTFDYSSEGFLYSCDWQTIDLKMIDIKTHETKVIGRCRGADYVRASKDNKYVAVCTEEVVQVYSREKKWQEFILKLKSEDDEESGTCEIEFTSSSNILGISYKNYIQIWSLEDWKLTKTLMMTTNTDICSFKFNKSDEWILAVGIDHSINAWLLDAESPIPEFMNQPIEEVNKKEDDDDYDTILYDLEIDEDRNMIFTHQRDSENSHVWKGIFLDKEAFPDSSGFNKENTKILTCRSQNKVVVTDCEGSSFRVWDIEMLGSPLVVNVPTRPLALAFSENEDTLFVGSTEKIYTYHSRDYSLADEIKSLWTGDVHVLASKADYIISGGTSKNIVIQTLQGMLIEEIVAHKSPITALKTDDQYLITGDESGVIYIHMLNSWTLYACLNEHTKKVTNIDFMANKEDLISVGLDNKCIFWSIHDKTSIKQNEIQGDVESCYIGKLGKNFLASTVTGEIRTYNLPSFQMISEIFYKNTDNQIFCMGGDDKFIIVSNDDGVFKTLSPLNPANPKISAVNVNIPKIIKFLNGELNDDSGESDSWVIAPFAVNSLHYYANAEGKKQNLKKAMLNNSLYLNSLVGTPLGISLLKSNADTTGTILSQLQRRVANNHFALETVADHLVELNLGGFNGLDEFYSACLIPKKKNVPEVCDENASLPVVFYGLNQQIDPLNFAAACGEDEGKKVTFLVSALRMNLEPGTRESILFLESLLECSNTEIFKTKFIQTILHDKWRRLKWIMIGNSLLFVFYLVFLSLFTIMKSQYPDDPSNWNYMIVCFIANVFLFVYELIQIFLDPVEYIQGVWNYLDLSRAGFLYAYIIQYYMFGNDVEWLIITTTVLSWVRGITLFTIFTSTRYMIGLIGEVLIDIIPFAAVVFYSILAFFFINLTVASIEVPVIGDRLVQSYFDAIGNFSTDGYTSFQIVMVLMASIFNLIIMMNLLISIIGTTYGRVNDDALVEDLKQLTNLIIESESLLFPRKNNKNKQVLQVCEEFASAEVAVDDIKTRFRTVRNELDALMKNSEKFQKTNEKLTQELVAKQELVASKVDSAKKDIISELKSTIEELRKKILESIEKADETEVKEKEANQKLFVCLNGHNLKASFSYDCYCDICFKNINDEEAFNCGICNFDMCSACADYYYDHNDVKVAVNCHEGHNLLHFQDISELVNEKNYEDQVCRLCNETVEGEGFHCIACQFSVCNRCRLYYEEAAKNKEKKTCKNKHALKWRHKEIYVDKSSMIITCEQCQDPFVGAGFYSCTECPKYYCLVCYKTEFLEDSDAEGKKEESDAEDEGENNAEDEKGEKDSSEEVEKNEESDD